MSESYSSSSGTYQNYLAQRQTDEIKNQISKESNKQIFYNMMSTGYISQKIDNVEHSIERMSTGIQTRLQENTYAIVASATMLQNTFESGFDSINDTLIQMRIIMKKVFIPVIILSIVFILSSCITSGAIDTRKYAYPEDKLGIVTAEKTYWHILFLDNASAHREELRLIALEYARKQYGDDIDLRNLKYRSKWSPASLLLYFDYFGYVEKATLTAEVYPKSLILKNERQKNYIGAPNNNFDSIIDKPIQIIYPETINIQSKDATWLSQYIQDKLKVNYQQYLNMKIVADLKNEDKLLDIIKQSESLTHDQYIEIGKFTTAVYGIFPKIWEINSEYSISLQLLDLTTGEELINISSKHYKDVESLYSPAGAVDELTLILAQELNLYLSNEIIKQLSTGYQKK